MKIIDLSPETQSYIEIIRNQMEKLGCLEEADKANLDLLASQVEIYLRAMKDLDKNGLSVTDTKNRVVVNPAFNVQRSAMALITSLMKELSISARQRRFLTSAGQTNEEDPMDVFLKEMQNE